MFAGFFVAPITDFGGDWQTRNGTMGSIDPFVSKRTRGESIHIYRALQGRERDEFFLRAWWPGRGPQFSDRAPFAFRDRDDLPKLLGFIIKTPILCLPF